MDFVGRLLPWLIAHTALLFLVLLIGLTLVAEVGFWLRRASPSFDKERQLLIEFARDGLGVLLSLLLGFTLPMAVPHYEQRNQLVVDEANSISTVEQRARMLPEPFRGNILELLREYVAARIAFATSGSNEQKMLESVNYANRLQNEISQQTVMLVQQNPNMVAQVFVQAIGNLSDLIEQRLAAAERRIPSPIWLVLILMSILTCFVMGYSIQRRSVLAFLVLPLTVAIVLSLVSDLDSPRTGFVRVGQQSMQRIQQELIGGH
jgi:hypothetical protein